MGNKLDELQPLLLSSSNSQVKNERGRSLQVREGTHALFAIGTDLSLGSPPYHYELLSDEEGTLNLIKILLESFFCPLCLDGLEEKS